MVLKILDTCINCGVCEAVCPCEAIHEGADIYVVDPTRCTECVGAFDRPKCIDICPVDGCIVPDPDRREASIS